MNYYEEPRAYKWEIARGRKRTTLRPTYDCFNAGSKDGLVSCKLGHKLGVKKRPALLLVLRGLACNICQFCDDFSIEDFEDDVRSKR